MKTAAHEQVNRIWPLDRPEKKSRSLPSRLARPQFEPMVIGVCPINLPTTNTTRCSWSTRQATRFAKLVRAFVYNLYEKSVQILERTQPTENFDWRKNFKYFKNHKKRLKLVLNFIFRYSRKMAKNVPKAP